MSREVTRALKLAPTGINKWFSKSDGGLSQKNPYPLHARQRHQSTILGVGGRGREIELDIQEAGSTFKEAVKKLDDGGLFWRRLGQAQTPDGELMIEVIAELSPHRNLGQAPER